MAHPTFPGISRMKSVMAVWLYSAEQYRQHTLLLEIAEHAARHGFNDAPVDVLVLHGHEFMPPGDIARLREWNFHVRDVSAAYAPIAARFPGLRTRYSNHFFECFLRWLVIKDVCGDAPVLAWDADIFFNEALSVLHGAYAGATFTSSSTCFVALSDPAWLATYERELLAFERDPASAIDGIRSALTARVRTDPSAFESSFFGPLIAAALPSSAEWTRLFDSTPEELFVDHLVRMGRLPHAVRPEVARYVLCAQPLLTASRAWVHPFGAGLPVDPAASWSHDGRQYWSNGRPLAFVHFQGALFRSCAVHQLLGDVLGEATLLHDAFYCDADRRSGHAVADVFFRDRADWLARAQARHGATLQERWGDLFSERDVAQRYLSGGLLIAVLKDHGRPMSRSGVDHRAPVAVAPDIPFIEGRISIGLVTARLLLDPRRTVQAQIANALASGRGYEPETAALLAAVLRPGDGFVDVGAHIGYFSILAASRVGPSGQVWSFEPDRENHDGLLRQVALLDAPTVRPYPMAVGEREGVVHLHANQDNDGGHALWDPAQHPANSHTRAHGASSRPVWMTTLDATLGALPPGRVRAMKVDVEGAEWSVLRGATRLLCTQQPALVILEINRFGLSRMGASEMQVRQRMQSLGYRLHAQLPDGRPPLSLGEDTVVECPYVFNLICTRV